MPRQALTEQQIAAMAAGAAVGTLTPVAEAAAAAAAAAGTEAAAAAAAVAATEAEAAAAVEAAAALAAAAVPAPDANLVAYLQAQVKEKDTALLAQSVELKGLKTKVEGMEASHAGLVKIAAQSVSNMKVGLGLAKVDLSALSPEMLLAEHDATATAFAAAFKVGGVAAINAPETEVKDKPVDHMHMARIAATRFAINTK